MPKYGKIARLPRNIRDELNRRLDNGEMGARLVEWLNGLPEVKRVLETDFAGREITQQNLTKWKTYGYLDWQAQQEALTLTSELNANATELSGDVTDSLAKVLAARYASALYGWNGEMTAEIRTQLRALRGISREVVRLRRSDQSLERIKIEREWLDWDRQKTGEVLAFNQQRYHDSRRSAESKAMQFCLDETEGYPEVQEAFKQAFATFQKARADKNQPETT